jgi:Ca2+-binding RTX toxin-like protein
MSGNAQGGDDRLSGGAGDDLLFGDAREMEDNAQGGNDTFVFDDAFGNDTVADFRQGEDELEFNVPGVTAIEDLQIAVVGADTVITADGTVKLT